MLLSGPVKVFARIFIGVCAGLHTFQCLYGLDSGEVVREIKLRASFGNIKISDLDFADHSVVFAEMLDILMGALEVLNEESQLLGLWDMNQLLNPANRLACTG